MTSHPSHPICITGMHRSGTSMVAGLLSQIGVYLGDELDFLGGKEPENAEGFREHFGFYALNERLLLHLGAGWDAPWLPAGWENREDLEPFRQEASLLIQRMRLRSGEQKFWGWKDPRNSVTLPFWKSLLPDVRVLICVRNPIEVAASLSKRNNFSLAASSQLWLHYYRSLLAHSPFGSRVITVYENYFEHFEEELTRIAAGLGMDVGAAALIGAKRAANQGLRHNRSSLPELYRGDFPEGVIHLYEGMLKEANTGVAMEYIPAAASESRPPPSSSRSDVAISRFHAETAQREEHMHRLIEENRRLSERLNNLEQKYFELLELHGRPPCGEGVDRHVLAERIEGVTGAFSALEIHRTNLLDGQAWVADQFERRISALPGWVRRGSRIVATLKLYHDNLHAAEITRLQREVHAALEQCLKALSEISLPQARHLLQQITPPPGLENADTRQTPVDISELSALLTQRVS